MKAKIEWKNANYLVQLDEPIDISITMQNGAQNPNAFHIPAPIFEPIRVGSFVGSVKMGSGANCENLKINAHGNGTHTECIGHITYERVSINSTLKMFFGIAQLISLTPKKQNNGDLIIELGDVPQLLKEGVNTLIIRTLPNTDEKKVQFYSGNNPVYLAPELCQFAASKGILHLLVDLPSVDREEDNGLMLAHKAFWNYPENPRNDATITEMIYVPNFILDNIYLINIQIASLDTDASPSKPVLYKLKEA